MTAILVGHQEQGANDMKLEWGSAMPLRKAAYMTATLLPRLFRTVAVLLVCSTSARADTLPAWVSVLPAKTGHVYALGTANSLEEGSETRAMARAAEHAKIELLSSLRASVKSSLQSSSSMQLQRNPAANAFDYEEQVQKTTRISAQARDLPGLGISETFIDQHTSSVYALAHLDLSAATAEIGRRQQQMEDRLVQLRAAGDLPFDEFANAEAFLATMETTIDMTVLFSSRIGNRQAERTQSIRDEYRNLLMQIKKKITFGFDEKAGEGRDLGALVSAVTHAGYSWSKSPRYRFDVQEDNARKFDFAYDRHVVKAAMNLLLVDGDGTVVRAAKISASGNGNTRERAEAQVDKRFDDEIHSTVKGWLSGPSTRSGDASPDGEDRDETTRAGRDEIGLTPGSSPEPAAWARP